MIRLHGLESRPASADRPPIDTYVQTPYNYGMTETTNKASRFEMRLTPSQKERLDQAAAIRALDEPMPEEMVRLLESETIWK